MRRGAAFVVFLTSALAACGLVAKIDDINVIPDGAELGPDAYLGDTYVPPDDSGPPPDSAPPDAGDSGIHCDASTPFGAPVAIAELNSPSDDSTARLSPDEKTVYLASQRSGHIGAGSVYAASRATPAAAFGAPTLVANVNNAGGLVVTYQPTVSGDGLHMYVQYEVLGSPSTVQIYGSSRSTTADAFSTPASVAALNTTAQQFFPYVSPDGQDIWFVSNRPNTNGAPPFVVYQSTMNGAGFGAPVAIGGLSSGVADVIDTAPVFSGDQLTIYFASTRLLDSGSYDVYVAHRATKTDAFGTPTIVTELSNTTAGVDDIPSWLSADACRIYLTSNRVSANGNDIYMASRTP